MHGFYIKENEKKIRLDIVVSFDSPDRFQTCKNVEKKVQDSFPAYKIHIVLDTDFSESEQKVAMLIFPHSAKFVLKYLFIRKPKC